MITGGGVTRPGGEELVCISEGVLVHRRRSLRLLASERAIPNAIGVAPKGWI
jgi:hypothetical protein